MTTNRRRVEIVKELRESGAEVITPDIVVDLLCCIDREAVTEMIETIPGVLNVELTVTHIVKLVGITP